MRIIIHRGAAQIGGCITEISTDKARILIDLGSNLPGSGKPDFSAEEIRELTTGVDAIFYTHYHSDHVGLMAEVDEPVSQYIGEGAREVMLCKYNALAPLGDYSKELSVINRMRTYEADRPISEYGDIVITPYYCSHSAFDAYMFKIRVGDTTILHTGDFRSHGYMGSKLIPMIKKYIGEVDILITEGTMLSRTMESVPTERDIQDEVSDVLRNHKYVFALSSSTDIDRLASFQAACKRNGRYFYVDRFQESVLDVFTKHTTSKLYDFSDKGKTLFVQWRYTDHRQPNIISRMKRRGFLMPVRCASENLIRSMTDIYSDEKPFLIYSMWNGYWKGTREQQMESVLRIRALFGPDRIKEIHTSGHADCATLKEVCEITSPRMAIIPVHKDERTDFRSLNLPQPLKERVVTSSTIVGGVEIQIK